jgi:hypothetical protein
MVQRDVENTELIPAAEDTDELAAVSEDEHKLFWNYTHEHNQSTRSLGVGILSVKSNNCAAVVNIFEYDLISLAALKPDRRRLQAGHLHVSGADQPTCGGS